MSELFNNYPIVKSRLVDYLTSINENINWDDFLTKYGTLPDLKILKRIRSLVWIDKSIEYTPHTYTTAKYFEYYMSLLMKFKPILDKYSPIWILPPKTSSLIDEFQYDLDSKFSILKRTLTMMGYKFELIDITKINPEMKVLIPLGSICYDNANQILSNFNGLIIPDGYNNICIDKNDEIMNNFILNINSLMMSADDVSNIYRTNYNMFYIKV